MRKTVLLCIVIISATLFFISCARGITPHEAANGKARCGRSLR